MNDSFEYDVFISFASKDAVAVQPLYEKLVSFGLRVFWSDKSLEPGGNWFDHIQEGVVNSKHFLLIWTQNAKGSRWVKDEYQTFYRECYQESNGKRLFIIKIDSNNDISSLPPFLRQIHVTDSESYILKRLGIKDPPPPPSSPPPTPPSKHKKVYLTQRSQLFNEPKGGRRTGPRFNIGCEFECLTVDNRGWCHVKFEGTDYFIPSSIFVFEDPRTFFEIKERKINGYLCGEMQGDKVIGNLDYIKIWDEMLGKIDIEIRKIAKLRIFDDNERRTEIEMSDGSLQQGMLNPRSHYGSSLNSYLISKTTVIPLHQTRNITLEQVR